MREVHELLFVYLWVFVFCCFFVFRKQIPRVNVDACNENDSSSQSYPNNHTLLGMPRPVLDIVQVCIFFLLRLFLLFHELLDAQIKIS